VFVAIAYDGEGPAGMGHDPAAAAAAAENLKRIEFADHSGE
jgi:hypothetical protein